ncbi:MAG: hydrogenase formation protein HypD, partial [Acetobacter sp.]|nr:hydrogenase formation protein HypD [Acetobacter sp.]
MPHNYNREAFRDPALVNKLFAIIEATAKRIAPTRSVPITIMEVCGGHTHTIFRYGLETRLPDLIEFAHGPGCPVCVLPRGR